MDTAYWNMRITALVTIRYVGCPACGVQCHGNESPVYCKKHLAALKIAAAQHSSKRNNTTANQTASQAISLYQNKGA
jgi:hypothetical protein